MGLHRSRYKSSSLAHFRGSLQNRPPHCSSTKSAPILRLCFRMTQVRVSPKVARFWSSDRSVSRLPLAKVANALLKLTAGWPNVFEFIRARHCSIGIDVGLIESNTRKETPERRVAVDV